MSRQRFLVPALVLAATSFAACGGGGGDNSATFADQLQDSCRSLSSSLRNIDDPSSLDQTEKAAKDASSAYDDAGTSLSKLSAPSKLAKDFQNLKDNFADEVDLYNDIAKAARAGETNTINTKLRNLAQVDGENADLADSLDARACKLSVVISSAATTTTEVPTTAATVPPTEVVDTLPPLTDPPTTAPRPTDPPETAPPSTESTTSPSVEDKAIIDRSGDLIPKGDYSFIDSGQDKVVLIRTLYAIVPKVNNQKGTMFGVDVINNGVAITRVVVFEPASPLTPGSASDVVKILASGNTTPTPATYGGLAGALFQAQDNFFFVSESSGKLILSVGKDEQSIALGTAEFSDSFSPS